MITCSICKRELHESCFLTYFHSTQQKFRTKKQCKECLKEISKLWKRKKRAQLREERFKEKSIKEYQKEKEIELPYYQMDILKVFMEKVICWSYDEETKTYYKPGIKEIDGTWPNVKKNRYTIKGGKKVYTKEVKEQVVPQIEEMRKTMKWGEIEKVFNISKQTLWFWYEASKKK